VGGGDTVWPPGACPGVTLPGCRSSRSSLSRYSCMEAWYDGGGGRYWNSGYIIAAQHVKHDVLNGEVI